MVGHWTVKCQKLKQTSVETAIWMIVRGCIVAEHIIKRRMQMIRTGVSNFVFKCDENRPPLSSSGQSSWLQIQRSGFDSRRYQIFWEVVGLERGPLSLMSTIEELLGRESSSSSLEIQEYGRRDLSFWPLGTLYPHKLGLTSPKSGCCSVVIVHSQTQATECSVMGTTIIRAQKTWVH
jgi:hypothetical protein